MPALSQAEAAEVLAETEALDSMSSSCRQEESLLLRAVATRGNYTGSH